MTCALGFISFVSGKSQLYENNVCCTATQRLNIQGCVHFGFELGFECTSFDHLGECRVTHVLNIIVLFVVLRLYFESMLCAANILS